MEHWDIKLPQQQWLIQRLSKKTILEPYKRLFFSVALINIAFLYYGLTVAGWWAGSQVNLVAISNMAIANFFIAIIIRQQYIINGLFWMATRAPTYFPLWLRWRLGKVYHFGGLHSGCSSIGSIWFLVFVFHVTDQYARSLPGVSIATLTMAYLILFLLINLLILALPVMRSLYHDAFEVSHRFGGWLILLLFWLLTLSFLQDQNVISMTTEHTQHPLLSKELWSTLATTPQIVCLTFITLSVILPWLRLKKVPVMITRPSAHVAIIEFNYGVTPFAGSSTTISRNPLLEWHAFANVPSPDKNGFRLTISRAGDWTGKFIDDCPSHVWVKGIPTAGVANIEVLFKRVIYVATGSGIGPCLPHLLAKKVPSLLVWSTRTPEKTYGESLVQEILTAQPNAIIWDTTEKGKPDMVKLAYAAYKQFDAEAVICISNQKLTNLVVYGMESRGIPAFGAIWDS